MRMAMASPVSRTGGAEMRFLTKMAIAVIASNLLAAQSEARPRTDFGVRSPPASPEQTRWPDRRPVSTKGGKPFTCTVAYVTDGDTFRCTSGVRVRLSSIDAPELPGHCRAGRYCVPGDPFAARAALSTLISGRTVTCEPVGTTYGRIAAWCSVGGGDLSCAMVQTGHAIPRYGRGRRVC
jgi:endonuclease YncB( thermonuclease family)